MVTPNRINAEMLLQGTSSQFLAANSTPSPAWVSPAVQADQETGTDLTKPITAGVEQYHQSSAKCWGFTLGGGTPVLNAVSYNMTSITDSGTGLLTVTIGNDFSSNAYCIVGSAVTATAATITWVAPKTRLAGSIILDSADTSTSLTDPDQGWCWVMFGDLP